RESGEAIFENAASGERLRFNEKFECKSCGMAFVEPEPALFSFNSPMGACPRCQGFGNTIDFDMNLVIPDTDLTLDHGAVEPWTKPKGKSWLTNFKKAAKGKVRFDVPFCELTEPERDEVYRFVRKFFDTLEQKKY